jgi:hypothetical protein
MDGDWEINGEIGNGNGDGWNMEIENEEWTFDD